MNLLWIYLTAMNVLGFVLMAQDKNKARKGEWRIPEKTLFLTALLGGSPGVWTGMYLFRHKTRKAVFVIGIPAIFLVQTALYIWGC